MPEVKGRYYTAQILDEWGEVITNINERNYPTHPFGKFVFVAPGSATDVAADAVRIELHSRKAKMLARVEIKTDAAEAVSLQKQFKLSPLGSPVIQSAVPMARFNNNKELLGVEIFDDVDRVVASAQDISPVGAQLQALARFIGQRTKDPEERKALDNLIRSEVVPEFLDYAVTKSGPFKNSWLSTLGTGNYGSDYWLRTSANLSRGCHNGRQSDFASNNRQYRRCLRRPMLQRCVSADDDQRGRKRA